MLNNTASKIIIEMKNIDDGNRFTKRLKIFCDIAAKGGDAELLIRQNGKIRDCGFVAHDLDVKSVKHEI